MRNMLCSTWHMAKKLTIVETETLKHCRTWKMVRNLTNEENEKLTW